MVTIPSPIDLASQANRYFKNRKYYQQRIVRAKSLIEPRSIVLADEFLDKCVYPHLDQDTYFARQFQPYIRATAVNLMSWIDTRHIPVFMLSEGSLKEPVHKHHCSYVVVRKEDSLRKEDVDAAIEDIVSGRPERQQDAHDKMKSLGLEIGNQDQRAGVYVGNALQAIKYAKGKGRNILKEVENKTVLRGHGNEALAFWEAVKDLADYSGHFPDPPQPRGGRRSRSRGAVENGALKPAFGT